jgi:hypothetical protein
VVLHTGAKRIALEEVTFLTLIVCDVTSSYVTKANGRIVILPVAIGRRI